MRIPSQFVGVFKIGNRYLPMYVDGKVKTAITKQFEVDRNCAELTAAAYARIYNMPYKKDLLKFDRPIISIRLYRNKWYPIEIRSEEVIMKKRLGELALDGSENQAKKIALLLAKAKKADCIFEMGAYL